MGNVQKLKEAHEEETSKKGAASPQKEAKKEAFYADPLFWVRVGAAIILAMVLITYFFFSE